METMIIPSKYHFNFILTSKVAVKAQGEVAICSTHKPCVCMGGWNLINSYVFKGFNIFNVNSRGRWLSKVLYAILL